VMFNEILLLQDFSLYVVLPKISENLLIIT